MEGKKWLNWLLNLVPSYFFIMISSETKNISYLSSQRLVLKIPQKEAFNRFSFLGTLNAWNVKAVLGLFTILKNLRQGIFMFLVMWKKTNLIGRDGTLVCHLLRMLQAWVHIQGERLIWTLVWYLNFAGVKDVKWFKRNDNADESEELIN